MNEKTNVNLNKSYLSYYEYNDTQEYKETIAGL